MRSDEAIRGKWRTLDGKEDEWSVVNSELQGGRIRLCRLRHASVGSESTSIDNVLAHMGFMGSHKLSSFLCRRVG
jgi:hypothetical protein